MTTYQGHNPIVIARLIRIGHRIQCAAKPRERARLEREADQIIKRAHARERR